MRFKYKGRNLGGKTVEGMIEGLDEKAVAIKLIQTSISPISIEPFVEQQDAFQSISSQLKLDYPSLEELAFFTRQMYSLVHAGVPLMRAVKVVLDTAKSPRLKEALVDVIAGIESGQALGVVMRKHPLVFPSLVTSLVNVGESTGSLDQVFHQLTIHFEREIQTRKRIKTALRYPTIVIITIGLAIAIINIVVIPAFSKFFGQFHAQLPLPTRILIATSDFTVNYWYWCLFALVAIIASWVSYLKTEKGRYAWDKFKLKIPLIGTILKRSLMARFTRAFALCIRSGVPLLESIGLLARSTDNVYISEKILDMRTYIEHGESLTNAATSIQIFTPLVLQMLSIGEESGEIDRLLDEVSDYYEQEVDYDVKKLGDAIEPIILIILGAMVLILALGVYLPMWDLSKAALGK